MSGNADRISDLTTVMFENIFMCQAVKKQKPIFAKVEDLIADIRKGRMVVIAVSYTHLTLPTS
ncbi:MAG: hypothetical protein N3G20_03275, partial [Verrucomicrobiae bacterium]|nr:hypothetical protein [Verrucomicrobiae bacterium]